MAFRPKLWYDQRKSKRHNTSIPEPVSPLPCEHKWKDFDWYLIYNIDGRLLDYTIYEPYVCIHCKERKDIALEHKNIYFDSNKAAYIYIETLNEQYPNIKSRAIVEDEINDAQLVDREYLKIAEWLHGSTTSPPSNNTQLKLEVEK